ncbi:MAG TPA: sigma-70 family RNA polymerase sigma factor [Polyangia bacterium]|jgi:RNA polymerase sigma-32 factor|nr:sigma-70 family RNA polymerase sigma factor [Polyangia bacterium]
MNDPTLQSYWRQIDAVPLLPADEQFRLAGVYARTRDPAIAQRLVAANLRLVVKIAHEYRSARENFADLIQEGNLGLMRAVEKFDPRRGVKLTSYAGWWIRAYVMRFLMEQGQAVKMGTTRSSRRAFCAGQRGPQDISLNQPLTSSDGGSSDRCRQDLLRDDDDRRPDRRLEDSELGHKFSRVFGRFAAQLDERSHHLVQERWLTERPRTLRELGKELSLSGERVRQMEQVLFESLRDQVFEELAA